MNYNNVWGVFQPEPRISVILEFCKSPYLCSVSSDKSGCPRQLPSYEKANSITGLRFMGASAVHIKPDEIHNHCQKQRMKDICSILQNFLQYFARDFCLKCTNCSLLSKPVKITMPFYVEECGKLSTLRNPLKLKKMKLCTKLSTLSTKKE